MEAKITRTIVDNNGKEYKIGRDVGFGLLRNGKCYTCVGVITDITEKSFTIKDVLIDRMCLGEKLIIKYEEVEDGVLESVSYG